MIVLGLHFGHDAAAAVVEDGIVRSVVVRERLNRVKHALSLDWRTIETALRDAGVTVADIDYAAITSTQNVDIIAHDPDRISVSFARYLGDTTPAPFVDTVAKTGHTTAKYAREKFFDKIFDPDERKRYETGRLAHYFPEFKTTRPHDYFHCGWIDDYVGHPGWRKPRGLGDVSSFDAQAIVERGAFRMGFHCPVTLTLDGRDLPAFFVYHHLAHAASAFYPSGFDEAVILSHDGDSDGRGYRPGMIFAGRGNHLHPLGPHHLVTGVIYYYVAIQLGLGQVGGEGKLMGLAPYGSPDFYDERFVGNWFDVKDRHKHDIWQAWILHCRAMVQATGFDVSALADRDRMIDPANTTIAASTQKLFEETMVRAVAAARSVAARAGIGTDTLCLVGGTALNCPANSRVAAESGFDRVVVPPWCDDSGLALGAALALTHNILDRPRPGGAQMSAYLGPQIADETIENSLANTADIDVEDDIDAPARAAADLAENKIIAWYEGRSEIGPRALGHRSLLSDPRDEGNWARVNELKRREKWRPFAPAVLAEKAGDWFSGCPLPSPHMLFTAQVRDARALPAITHVDGSSRIQTVDEEAGDFRKVLEQFGERTGVPVVMNTSFNGPGEPIVESPEEALAFLRTTELDALYLAGRRITRK